MKPLFTIHAGEYLVGSHIEKNFPEKRVWIPSKDTGIDLLVTSESCEDSISLQVKFSKDYSETHWPTKYKEEVIASTWFQFTKNEIKKSNAAFWVLVAYPFSKGNVQYLIIEPKTLLERITNIYGEKEKYNLYFTFCRVDFQLVSHGH